MSSSDDSSSDEDTSRFRDVVSAVESSSFTSLDKGKDTTSKPSLRNKYFGNDPEEKPQTSSTLQNRASNRLDALLNQSISFSNEKVSSPSQTRSTPTSSIRIII